MKSNKRFKKDDWDIYWKESKYNSHFDKARKYFDDQYIKLIKNFIPENGKIIEVGCGTGYCSQKIAAYKGSEIYALDYSNQLNKFWEEDNKVKFIVGDGFNMKFKDNFFDLVWNAGVLEHLQNPLDMLIEMKRVCKKQGFICVIVPYLFDVTAYLRIYGKETIYTKEMLKKLLKKTGLREVKTKVLWKCFGFVVAGYGKK